MNFPHRVLICTCSHAKRDHVSMKLLPNGPCQLCPCVSFTPEPVCRCNHGKKAHTKGYCHEGDGCREFRPKTNGKEEATRRSPQAENA